MKTTFTKNDISRCTPDTIDLGDGYTAKIETEYDQDSDAPWEECDGHGPVSDWTTRDKRPGERVLCSDHGKKRFYDDASAIKEAKRDGWDAKPYKTGTKGEQASRAVEADFEYLRKWCNDQWHYIGVIVTLLDANDCEVASDSLWGVEDLGDYWRETAAEMLTNLAEKQTKEIAERAEWEARDTMTA